MINLKEDLFEFLVNNFPCFIDQWNSIYNYNIMPDGSYSCAGLCAEFSHFYIENYDRFDLVVKKSIMGEFEYLLFRAESDPGLSDLAGSVRTCFFENIAQTLAGSEGRDIMGPLSKMYFDEWHVEP